MDFLQKLDALMRRDGLNRRSLSLNSGIPYTTIDGWYKKGYDGVKLPTLRKLAEFFSTDLDYWAYDEPEGTPLPLAQQEKVVIQAYRDNPAMQPAVDRLLGVESKKAPSEEGA